MAEDYASKAAIEKLVEAAEAHANDGLLLTTYDRDAMIAKLAEMGYGEGWSRTNLYVCEKFGEHGVWTIERTPGVTPFLIRCDACDGANYMQSMMGRAGDAADQVCMYEWDFPTNAEFERLDREMQRHVLQGGLIRRPNPNFGKWESS